jgi:hypothetical protein
MILHNFICRSAVRITLMLMVAAGLQAQQVYTVSRAFKVKPGQAAEFEKFVMGFGQKYHQVRKDTGTEAGWVLLRLVSPSGEEAPYHYVSTSFHTTFPELDRDPAIAAALTKLDMTQEQFTARLNAVATTVRRTVNVRIDSVGEMAVGDYVRVDYMKVLPNHGAEYVDMERRIYKPIQEQRVKEGIIKGWSINAWMLPGGSERPYQFFTTNVVKDSQGLGSMRRGYNSELFAKAHPNLNYMATTTRMSELRDIVRSYLMRVVAQVK